MIKINKSLQITALLSSCFMLFAGGCAQESGEVKSAAQTPETSQIAAAEAPAVVDSQTMELLEATSKYLSAQPALSVGWFISYETQGDGDAPLRMTRTWNGENTLIRDKGYYVVCEHGDNIDEFRYDGETLTAIYTGKNIYAATPMTGSIDTLAASLEDKHNLALPAWELFSENVSETLLSDVTRAEYVGITSILGQPVHHLSFSEPGQDWEIWVSTDDSNPVPLMMAGHDPDVDYSGYQAMFHDWETQPDAMQTSFTFEPPEGLKKVEFSALNDSQAENE